VLLSLSTGHTIGLLLVAGTFIVVALVCSLVIPRYRPGFPGDRMGAFIAVALLLFVATLLAVNFFGVEAPESEASSGGQESTPAETQPATTGATTTSAAPAGDATKGKALYTSLGCVGCHSLDGSKGTGPTFKGLGGSKVQLTNGQSVTADEAYLTKSIDDPDAEVVQGYSPGIMSAVIKPGSVSQADTADLVAYIQTVK
jgi:mono/diheme cytochrome c family protein